MDSYIHIGFTRQETSVLSGLTLNKLDYLNKKGIIKPQKVGSYANATTLYEWNQILALRIYNELKKAKLLPNKKIDEIINALIADDLEMIFKDKDKPVIVLDTDTFSSLNVKLSQVESLKNLKYDIMKGEKYFIFFDNDTRNEFIKEILPDINHLSCFNLDGILARIMTAGEENNIVNLKERIRCVA